MRVAPRAGTEAGTGTTAQPARAAWALAIVLAGLLVAGQVAHPTATFDPFWLITPLNLVFLTLVPLVGAGLAVRAYERTGVVAVLGLGAGTLATGLGAGVVPAVLLFTEGTNATITLHNTSVLLAAGCQLAAAIGGMFVVSLGRRRRRHVATVYGLVTATVAVVLALAILRLTPEFWNGGPTAVRQATLGGAVTMFGLSAFAWWQTALRDRGIRFLAWYVPGLTLFALGLAGVLVQNVVGGLEGWIGRAGQYCGALCMLVAVAQATRAEGPPARRNALGVALLQAALPLRPLVESTSDAVIALGRDGRVVYWNDAARRTFGYDTDEAFDAEPIGLVDPEPGTPATRSALRAMLASPAAAVAAGRRLLVLGRRDGSRFEGEISAFASPDDPRLLVLVITDASERVRLQAELETRVLERTASLEQANAELARANAAKDEFLGLVSHELKTPVTTLVAASALLARRLGADDPDGLLGDLTAESARLARIIDNLLALARVDAGPESEIEPVALERLLSQSITSIGRAYPDRTIGLRAEHGIIVEASEARLAMLMRNLLSNALKYSPPDAPVDVTLVRDGSWACVTVRDRGIGIEDDEAAAIFEPFYRSASTSATPGIGIGLTVCRRIVEALGGEIRAARCIDGDGSEFTVRLPLEPVGVSDADESGPAR